MRKTILSAAFILVAFSLSAQLSNFNGTWKINKEKSNLPEFLYMSQVSVAVKGDSLLTTRTYTDQNYQEYPFTENVTLDGKEAKITIYDMPRVTKATKGENGSIILESKTTAYGGSGEEDLIAKEIWKSDGNNLTIDNYNAMSGQEYKGVLVYDKVK